MRPNARCVAVATGLAGLTIAPRAAAHVKWFFPYDLDTPPLPPGEVLTPTFVYLFLASVGAVYAFFWLDRFSYRRYFLGQWLNRLAVGPELSFRILSVAVAIFFLALFAFAMAGKAFYLTPELRAGQPGVAWLQLLIAGAALVKRTAPLVGAGILLLYGLAVAEFGVFHLLDYLIFLGVGVYFLLSGLRGRQWLTARYVTLFASTALTLLWASVEKWAYPVWTYPLLAADPSLLMGMTPQFYMLFAGFVEFNITFMLISSVSVFARITAFGLNAVFVLAIFEFGLIDAVGHLLIIAILVVLVVRGPTSARYFLVLSDKTVWTEAYFMTGLYVLAFDLVFIAYYGLYYLTR